MFYECSSLKEINNSSFVINEKTNMSKMFCGCNDELKKIKFIVKKKRSCYLF